MQFYFGGNQEELDQFIAEFETTDPLLSEAEAWNKYGKRDT